MVLGRKWIGRRRTERPARSVFWPAGFGQDPIRNRLGEGDSPRRFSIGSQVPLAPEPGQPLHLWTDWRGQVGRFWTASFVSTSGRQQAAFFLTRSRPFLAAIGHWPQRPSGWRRFCRPRAASDFGGHRGAGCQRPPRVFRRESCFAMLQVELPDGSVRRISRQRASDRNRRRNRSSIGQGDARRPSGRQGRRGWPAAARVGTSAAAAVDQERPRGAGGDAAFGRSRHGPGGDAAVSRGLAWRSVRRSTRGFITTSICRTS